MTQPVPPAAAPHFTFDRSRGAGRISAWSVTRGGGDNAVVIRAWPDVELEGDDAVTLATMMLGALGRIPAPPPAPPLARMRRDAVMELRGVLDKIGWFRSSGGEVPVEAVDELVQAAAYFVEVT